MISILKISKGNNSAKRFNFNTNHIQNTKWHKTEKNCRKSNSSQSKSGHTLFVLSFVK